MRKELAAQLRALPGSDVLGALESGQRAQLDELLGSLSLQEKSQLEKADNPLVRVRPLLHLAAGGTSREAYLQIAITRAAVEELMAMQMSAGALDLSPVLKVSGELSKRAGGEALHQSAALLEAGGPLTALVADEVREVARALGDLKLAQAAVELAAELEPGRARLMAVASISAGARDVARAKSAWDEASKLKDPVPVDFLETIGKQVAAAEQLAARKVAPATIDEAVSVARQHLRLEDFAGALAVLKPFEGQLASHLGAAVTSTRATMKDSVCPGLPPRLHVAQICALAWKPHAQAVTASLDAAWNSGNGRDAEAVEGYLGFNYVVPWMYGYMGDGAKDPRQAARAFLKRIEEFAGAAKKARDVDPGFEGIEMFVSALREGFVAGASRRPGQRMTLPKHAQDKLMRWALEVGEKQSGRFPSAGVLAVAALLSQDRDVLPLLNVVKGEMSMQQLRALAVLRIWSAATGDRIEVAVEAGKEINELVRLTDEGSMDRTELVLMMAETETALLKTPKTLKVLRHVAEPLLQADIDIGVKYQAALDVAALEARDGKRASATSILTEVVTSATAEQLPPEERDLWIVAKAYLLVLRALDATGTERVDYRKKLDDHAKAVAVTSSASIQAWISIWQEELAALIDIDKCAGAEACVKRAHARYAFRRLDLDRRVGAEAAGLLRRGTLGAGVLNLSFSFSGNGEIVPVVSLEPRFLAVEFPQRFLDLHAPKKPSASTTTKP